MTRTDLLFRTIKKHTGYSKSDLMNPTNHCDVDRNEARYISILIARCWLGLSFNQVGRIFKRDNKSVRYAIRKVRENPDLLVKAIIIQAEIMAQQELA